MKPLAKPLSTIRPNLQYISVFLPGNLNILENMKTPYKQHHIVLGELEDFLTGEKLTDTHDERYRQKLARLLVDEKGYAKQEIEPRRPLVLKADEERAKITVDLAVRLSGRVCIIVQYGPGSLVSRHRPTLGISRLVEPYQVPVAVVTNGEDADVLEGSSGKLIAKGLAGIPRRRELEELAKNHDFSPLPPRRVDMESRIAFAFEVDCSCSPEDKKCNG